MSKDDVLFSIIGLLLGFILGFFVTNSFNQKAAAPAPTATNAPGPTDAGPPQQQLPDPQVLEAAKKKAAEAPDDYEAQMAAGEAFYRAIRYQEAINYLLKANQIRPQDVEPMVALGNTYFDDAARNRLNGQWLQAEKWYAEALKVDEKNVNVRTDLGLTFFYRTPPDYEKAIGHFRKSLEIDPEHLPSLQNLAIAFNKTNKKSESEAILAKLDKLNPELSAKAREEMAK
jgi:tetratricopeptide (TPR) repeat protein